MLRGLWSTYMATCTVWTSANSGAGGSSITVLVDSGASEHFLDPCLTPDLQDRLSNYNIFKLSRKIVTAGQHILEGITTGTVHDTVNDVSGRPQASGVVSGCCRTWPREEPVLGHCVVKHESSYDTRLCSTVA